MSKSPRLIHCDGGSLEELKMLAARRTTPSGMAQRAKIILACMAGETVQNIVSRLHRERNCDKRGRLCPSPASSPPEFQAVA